MTDKYDQITNEMSEAYTLLASVVHSATAPEAVTVINTAQAKMRNAVADLIAIHPEFLDDMDSSELALLQWEPTE